MEYSTEMLNSTGVYAITNLVNGKQYIGSTTMGFNKRWKSHLLRLKNNKHHSPYLQYAFNKYTEEVFQFIIIEICSKEDCLVREQYYIDSLKVCDRDFGYNLCSQAGNTVGLKHTDETKAKMSARMKNNKICLGYKHTNEAKANMSKSKLGNTNCVGYKHTAETKAKVALASTGRKHNCKTHILISPNGEVVIVTDLKQFCIDNNLSYGCMKHVKAGRHRHQKGWTYKDTTLN